MKVVDIKLSYHFALGRIKRIIRDKLRRKRIRNICRAFTVIYRIKLFDEAAIRIVFDREKR